jgi:hypothetical protein
VGGWGGGWVVDLGSVRLVLHPPCSVLHLLEVQHTRAGVIDLSCLLPLH